MEQVSLLSPLHSGNDDILTICTLAVCEWAENQLEMQPMAEIQTLSFWEVLAAHDASQLLDYLLPCTFKGKCKIFLQAVLYRGSPTTKGSWHEWRRG